MPFLIFFAVIVVGTTAIILLTKRLFPGRGPVTPIVRISLLNNEMEADLQRRTLTATGIWSEPRGGSFMPRLRQLNFGYTYEIWVKEEDAERARAVLGID